jgi:hypothetical protein
MNFTGIGPRTIRFVCCYRNGRSSADNPQDKRIETFGLNGIGLAQFFKTLAGETCAPIEAAVTGSSRYRR